ncbi:unnamed protein product, partial [Hapterophycus canaliculatus]
MTSTLLQFGAVILVVMIGFAMALHVLFNDSESFGQTLLGLFKAMLGDADFFDEFSGGRYDRVATILVVVYLFIVTIMLLNLLIAILSTSHAQVQGNAGGALKVSKARIVHQYQTAVADHLLPAPFNLVQLFLSLCGFVFALPYSFIEAKRECPSSADGRVFWRKVCERARQAGNKAREAFGRLVFWFVLGPAAVAGGAILWFFSGLSYSQYMWHTYVKFGVKYIFDEDKSTSSSGRILQGLLIALAYLVRCLLIVLAWTVIFLWCILGAPCLLLLGWLIAPGLVWYSGGLKPYAASTTKSKASTVTDGGGGGATGSPKHPTIESMLREGSGGVGAEKLLTFLQDPMDDDDVRQDEKDIKTTVEHIKLLRNRLESTIEDKLYQLRNRLEVRI